MFSGSVGPLELIVVLLIVLVIFGPKRLPSLGRQLGRGMREFKESITGHADDDEDERTGLEGPVSAPAPSAATAATTGATVSAPDTPGTAGPVENPEKTRV